MKSMDLSNASGFVWREVSNARIGEIRRVGRSKRAGLTSTLVGSKVYAIGGTVSALYPRDMDVLDLTTKTWKQISLPRGTERRDHVTFLWNDYIYVYSGWHRRIVTDLYRVDLLSEGNVEFLECYWDGIEELNFDYFSGSFCEVTRELVLFGGMLRDKLSNRTFCLRPDTQTFYEPMVKGQIPVARHKQASCCVRSRVFVYGGRGVANNFLCDLNILDMTNHPYVWSQVATTMVGRSAQARLVHVGARLFLLGGISGQGKGNFNVYSLRKRQWLDVQYGLRPTTSQPYTQPHTIWLNSVMDANYAFDLVATQNRILVLGGTGPHRLEYWTISPTD